jgi:hypothetical protein
MLQPNRRNAYPNKSEAGIGPSPQIMIFQNIPKSNIARHPQIKTLRDIPNPDQKGAEAGDARAVD